MSLRATESRRQEAANGKRSTHHDLTLLIKLIYMFASSFRVCRAPVWQDLLCFPMCCISERCATVSLLPLRASVVRARDRCVSLSPPGLEQSVSWHQLLDAYSTSTSTRRHHSCWYEYAYAYGTCHGSSRPGVRARGKSTGKSHERGKTTTSRNVLVVRLQTHVFVRLPHTSTTSYYEYSYIIGRIQYPYSYEYTAY